MSGFKKALVVAAGLVFVAAIASSLYSYLNPKKAKSERLECFGGVVVFERIYSSELLDAIKNQVASGEFAVEMRVQKSEYAESKLFDFVDADAVKADFMKVFNHKADSDKAKIEVLIYENDILDPRKKTAEALIYAGYIRAKFLYENQLIYQFQIDFMDKEGKDIPKTVSCIKEAFTTAN